MKDKDLIASKNFIGLLIMLLGPVAARYGIETGELQTLVEILSMAFGAVLNIYGRVKAKTEIGSVAGIKLK